MAVGDARQARQPATPTKFALGLIGVGLGFLVLVPGAQIAADAAPRSACRWLFMVYLIHTLGELCLSPVGLSAMTKLAPARIVSLMMGVWFLGASVGNFLGGQAASFYETMPLPTLLDGGRDRCRSSLGVADAAVQAASSPTLQGGLQ